ncbi:MAG TPA: DUF1501 domain-containing protein [Nannocystis sp.]
MTKHDGVGRWSRRGLLGAGMAAGGLLAGDLFAGDFAMQRLVQAGSAIGRRFVFIYVPGGWDQLLFLDPREFEYGLDQDAYQKEVERTGIDTSYARGGYNNDLRDEFGEGLNRPAGADPAFSFGPAAVRRDKNKQPIDADNLVALAEQGVPMAIIRGINMGTLGHEPGYVYFLTGEPAVGSSARGASMPVRLASQIGKLGGDDQTVVSNLAVEVDSYTGNADGRYAALRLGTITDSERLLMRETKLGEAPGVEAALATHAGRKRSPAAELLDGDGLLSQYAAASGRARELIESDVIQHFEFMSGNDPESQALRAAYHVQGDDPRQPAAKAAFTAQAIKYGLAQFISVSFPGGGDSHGGGNRGHATGLHEAVRALADLVRDLAKTPAEAPLAGTWLDNTTIVMFSEFGRTPRFNSIGGRDHHFSNSCLLVGAGIQAGRVVGGTTEVGGMQPKVYDFTGQKSLGDDAIPTGTDQRHITPADIGATLLASVGGEYWEYRDAVPLWQAITQTPF